MSGIFSTVIKVCVFVVTFLLAGVSIHPAASWTACAAEGDTGQTTGQNNATVSLSLEEALKMALENNFTIKYADNQRRQAYINAEQAKSLSRNLENAAISSSSTQLAKYANRTITANEKLIADKTYDVAKEQLKLLVEKKYYEVMQAEDLVKVNEAALERANKQLENAQSAFNIGTVAKTDVLGAEVGVAQAKTNLTAARNGYDIAVIELNRTIGLDLNTSLNLTSRINTMPMPDVELSSIIEDAMKTRLDVAKAGASLDNAKLKLQALEDIVAGTYEYKLAALNVSIAEMSLEDVKNQVVSDLTQAYLNIKTARETMNYLNAGVEQAKENVRLTNLRYQVGMATSLEVIDASVDLADIEANYVKALYSYNIAILAFETAKLAPSS